MEASPKVVSKTTVASFSKKHGISVSHARKKLNEIVESGYGCVHYGTIIEQRSMKRGARSRLVAIRGNLYELYEGWNDSHQLLPSNNIG